VNNGATFVKIDKMKHSLDGDYALVIEGDTPLICLFPMYLELLIKYFLFLNI
jgi:hypothetical protein